MQRRHNELTTEALESTTALLTLNPEYYSAWNFRREILQHLFRQADEAEQDSIRTQLLAEDITMTQQSMRTHPKVYWLWNHRRWCLHALPNPDKSLESGQKKWRKELALVDVMLDMDPRNFMGWNYRRFVIAELAAAMVPGQTTPFPVFLSSDSLKSEEKQSALQLAKDELQYTLHKIESNFSNFSAWHYRSKLLPRVWDAKQLCESDRTKERDQGKCESYTEFELLQQAMYTDPNDQSIWIYHSWLMSQGTNKTNFQPPPDNFSVTRFKSSKNLQNWSRIANVRNGTHTGCLQSLVEYKRRLLSLPNHTLEMSKRKELAREIESHLSRLVETDPLRRSRYEELRHSYMSLINGNEAE